MVTTFMKFHSDKFKNDIQIDNEYYSSLEDRINKMKNDGEYGNFVIPVTTSNVDEEISLILGCSVCVNVVCGFKFGNFSSFNGK